jgi:two-component system LytT family response regulator
MMEKLRTLIVDDEPLARDGIRMHLEEQPDVEIIGECADGPAAVEAIRRLEPDLIFLDVQMPGLDGFGVLEKLRDGPVPEVVFVTAYDQFALQAFESHALDYLLKPFDADRFKRSLDRVRTHLRGRRRMMADARLFHLLDDLRNKPRYLERIVVRSGGRILILRVDDVDWIESAANYVKLHVGGRTYLLRETMTRMEEMLDPKKFVRIHRSTIVRVERIRMLEPLFQGDFLVILEDGSRLPSSRGYRENLQELLNG